MLKWGKTTAIQVEAYTSKASSQPAEWSKSKSSWGITKIYKRRSTSICSMSWHPLVCERLWQMTFIRISWISWNCMAIFTQLTPMATAPSSCQKRHKLQLNWRCEVMTSQMLKRISEIVITMIRLTMNEVIWKLKLQWPISEKPPWVASKLVSSREARSTRDSVAMKPLGTSISIHWTRQRH